MGIRSQLGLLLLCLTILATSLVQSCNREPEPTAIDISQPTLQNPPVELWRKRVVTKPPTEKKRDKLMEDMDWKKLAKAEGWTLRRSPILLPNGEILVVTSNTAFDNNQSSSKGWADPISMLQDNTKYRLLIVSTAGKIKLHNEFPWGMLTNVVPDPAGEYLAFVVQDDNWLSPSSSEKGSGKQTISALDSELKVAWEIEKESQGITTFSFSVSESMMVWENMKSNLGSKDMTYSSEVIATDRDGSVIWSHQLPDANVTFSSVARFLPLKFESDGTIFISHSTSVYAFDMTGQKLWTRPTDYCFNSHPVLLPNGNLALAGDTSHELSIPGMSSEMPDYKSSNISNEDFGELMSAYSENLINEYETYRREYDRLPGYLLMLTVDGEILSERKLPGKALSSPLAFGDEKLLVNVAIKEPGRSGTTPSGYKPDNSRLMCQTFEGEIIWDRSFDTRFTEWGILVSDLPGGDGKCIIAAGDDGNLYCLDESGELLWVITGTEIDPASLAVGPDGLIYVVAGGELVCYSTGDISGGSSSGLSMILPGSSAFGSG